VGLVSLFYHIIGICQAVSSVNSEEYCSSNFQCNCQYNCPPNCSYNCLYNCPCNCQSNCPRNLLCNCLYNCEYNFSTNLLHIFSNLIKITTCGRYIDDIKDLVIVKNFLVEIVNLIRFRYFDTKILKNLNK
jgi:hypothetical protein